MIQKIKKALLSIGVLGALLTPSLIPAAAGAEDLDIQGSLKCGSNVDVSGNQICNKNTTTGTDPSQKIKDIINIFSAIVGVVAVIMIIYGGFRYIASGGKQESVTAAKNTLLYALVGLIIVAFAQIIVHFVLNKTTDNSSPGNSSVPACLPSSNPPCTP